MNPSGKTVKKRLRIAFSHMPGGQWSAGIYYLKNLFFALQAVSEKNRPEIVLLVHEKSDSAEYETLIPFVDEVLPRPAAKSKHFLPGVFQDLCKKAGIVSKKDNPVSTLLKQHGVDLFFTIDSPHNFGLPFLSWIPDFQHIHYPVFFSKGEIESRNGWFSNSAKYAKRVVLSSNDALNDYKSFAPWASEKGRVVSFVAQLSEDVFREDPEPICEKYTLPKKFILLPNQFWQHKNHLIVIQALQLALKKEPHLTVVCTGNTNENRKLSYFSEVLCAISEAGVRDCMILLGLVPREDLFRLMRQSIAVLQPSLFEGWNTTVEEVKSLGKRIIVSDISVHREQNPAAAIYFKPDDARELARKLLQTYETGIPGPDETLEQQARDGLKRRTVNYGEQFLRVASECVGDVTV